LSQVNPVVASSLQGFLQCVAQTRKRWRGREHVVRRLDERQLWFRGQQCGSWGLEPKLYRAEFKGAHEAEIRFQFQSRALQLLPGRVPQDDWGWYFLMQHYGCPTRLLDWSDNPLAALFFALESMPADCPVHNSKNCDRVVWVLDPWKLNKLSLKGIEGPMLSEWEEARAYLLDLEISFDRKPDTDFVQNRKLPVAIDPPHIDRRLAVQSSHFVIFGRARNLARISSVTNLGARTLARITIPAANVELLGEELEHCGVVTPSIFPDLDNLGRFIAHLARRISRA
jgi:hypothetical protein